MLRKFLVPSVVLLYANGASKYFEKNQETHVGFKELCLGYQLGSIYTNINGNKWTMFLE